MQKVIDEAVKELIKIINSKQYSETVAQQFVYEELEEGQNETPFVQQVISNCGISKSKYDGAMNRSWDDVDGADGPQQYLLRLTMVLAHKTNIELALNVRISIVEYIMSYYKLGKYSQKAQEKEKKTTQKYIDLFNIQVDKDRLHPHFMHLTKEENKPLKDVLIKWASNFEDRDKKFSKEFQTTFNSSFWELYLFQCFKELGMRVDFSKASPDFTVNTSYGTVNIEAVTSNHANEDEPEWSLKAFKSHTQHLGDKEFLDYASVRLLNSINSKHRKYIKRYSKLGHVKNKPFIVAVAPYEQAGFFMQNNEAINRVLYAQGVDKKTWQEIIINTVEKKNGVELELGMFTSDKYKEISAVIFSTTATMSKVIAQTDLNCMVRVSKYHSTKGLVMDMIENSKYSEVHVDGLQIHYNPFAENPLDHRIFDEYEISHYLYDTKLKKIQVAQNDNTLVSRNIWFINSSN